ncbi:MAG: restriction endonuclease [bacterium]|nr:restriction endonuclease [bacterium]
MKRPIFIVKASGERELWDSKKLERSLRAAKADKGLAQEVVRHIEKDLRDGLRTSDIYAHAFSLLKRYDRPLAAEYSLRKSLALLGPTGFPFERFVAKLLEAEGYRTQVGKMVRGACVLHEVDVIAEKDDERILVEAKFHNSSEIKSDVKVALYVAARFDDIAKRMRREEDAPKRFTHAWLITNTSFTSQAVKYGTCAGLALTGWNHPKGRTLQDLVQENRMHPVTCLTTLNTPQKTQLLNEGIVLCRDILKNPARLLRLGVNRAKVAAVVKEGERLCPVTT